MHLEILSTSQFIVKQISTKCAIEIYTLYKKHGVNNLENLR